MNKLRSNIRDIVIRIGDSIYSLLVALGIIRAPTAKHEVLMTKSKPNQKFQKGDWVRVVKKLPKSKRHFYADCEAVVVASYADQFGGDDVEDYTLHIRGIGEVSWYADNEFTLTGRSRPDKIEEWETSKEVDFSKSGYKIRKGTRGIEMSKLK